MGRQERLQFLRAAPAVGPVDPLKFKCPPLKTIRATEKYLYYELYLDCCSSSRVPYRSFWSACYLTDRSDFRKEMLDPLRLIPLPISMYIYILFLYLIILHLHPFSFHSSRIDDNHAHHHLRVSVTLDPVSLCEWIKARKSIDERKKEKEKSYPFSYWNKKKGSKWLARFLIKRDKVNFAARLPSTNWPYSDGGRGLFRVVSLERACSKDGRERKLARAKFVTVQSRRPFSANGGGGFFWIKSSIRLLCRNGEKPR